MTATCDCGYPETRHRSGSGHDPYCPCHAEWANPPKPCKASQYCGNTATTTRYNGVHNVPVCEACAAEHDEQE
jgi:hypothetical protein